MSTATRLLDAKNGAALRRSLYVRIINRFFRLCIASVFVVHQGCAHTTSAPIISESIQKNIHRIGVVMVEGQEESFDQSRRGWLSSMGKGAAGGSLLGGAGLLCYVGAIVCIPVLAAAGAVGGSIYGAYQASSETLPADAEAMFSQAINDAGLSSLLVSTLVADAQRWGYPMEASKRAPVAIEKNKTQLPAFQDPFDTILKIEGPVVNLLPTSFEIDPPRRVGLSVRLRVIKTADQAILDDRTVLEDLGEVRSLDEWKDHQAQHFRDELPRATLRLSEKILMDYFAKFNFDERRKDFRLFGPGHGYGFRLRGLASPSQIRAGPERIPVVVESLLPTLQWEQFEGNEVTYDMKIWESKDSRTQLGQVIYDREGLTENRHTVEKPLRPATIYQWSVRVRLMENGKVRVSEWTTYKTGFTTTMKIISFGLFALFESVFEESHFDWGFYLIQTPG